MEKPGEPPYADLILELIRKQTKSIEEGGKIILRSNLSFRGLMNLIQQEAKKGTRAIILGKDKTYEILCNYLVRKGLVKVKIGDYEISDFDQIKSISAGKKWEIIATELSSLYASELIKARSSLLNFDTELKSLESISSRKFTIDNIYDYCKLKNKILQFPLKTYFDAKEISINVRDEFVSEVFQLLTKYTDRLKKIKNNQEIFYKKFDDLIHYIDERNQYNSQIGFNLWSDTSRKTKAKKMQNLLKINTTEIKHILRGSTS